MKGDFERHLEGLIAETMKARVYECIDQQVEEFRRKLESEVDQMVLQTMQMYEIHSDRDRLVISVKKQMREGRADG